MNLIDYLFKNYELKEGYFMNRLGIRVFGKEIVTEISTVFNETIPYCQKVFEKWAANLGLSIDNDSAWRAMYFPKKLRVRWSPELEQDLHAFGVDAEQQLVSLLLEQVITETNSDFLKYAESKKVSTNDFIDCMKCVGYTVGPTEYDMDNFHPAKKFIASTLEEELNERQNNILWQNWIRSRKQNA
jgi:hypothetical protein